MKKFKEYINEDFTKKAPGGTAFATATYKGQKILINDTPSSFTKKKYQASIPFTGWIVTPWETTPDKAIIALEKLIDKVE